MVQLGGGWTRINDRLQTQSKGEGQRLCTLIGLVLTSEAAWLKGTKVFVRKIKRVSTSSKNSACLKARQRNDVPPLFFFEGDGT